MKTASRAKTVCAKCGSIIRLGKGCDDPVAALGMDNERVATTVRFGSEADIDWVATNVSIGQAVMDRVVTNGRFGQSFYALSRKSDKVRVHFCTFLSRRTGILFEPAGI